VTLPRWSRRNKLSYTAFRSSWMWNAISDTRDSGKPHPVVPRDCLSTWGSQSAARTCSSDRSSLVVCLFAVKSALEGYTHFKISNARVPIPSGPQFLVIQCQKLPICSDYREWYSQRMPVRLGAVTGWWFKTSAFGRTRSYQIKRGHKQGHSK
jgi:hypothetical protein